MKCICIFLFLALVSPAFSQPPDFVDSTLADHIDIEILKNPNRKYRAETFAHYLDNEHNTLKARYYYNLLKRDYADIPSIQRVFIKYNPDAAIQVGRPIPSFEVPLINRPDTVSNVSMLGKYYIIDFWTTWCGPCTYEIGYYLSKAYQKYKGKKGFEILSISLDEKEYRNIEFGTKKWKMPWLTAHVNGMHKSGGFEAELTKKFEVTGVPEIILVGPDGKILALSSTLRGEELEKTLEEFLGE